MEFSIFIISTIRIDWSVSDSICVRTSAENIMKEELGLILEGKTVLITGGGGTVGTEIALQAIKWKPDRIVCLGRSKKKLVDVVVNAQKVSSNVHVEIDLCDITDRGRIDELFSKYRPDIVFHMAAEKDIRLTNDDPIRAVTVNVQGTCNVVGAASEFGVARLAFASSIKADHPSSVMGATKRLGEMIVGDAANHLSRIYYTVRLSNVLESSGGVHTLFCKQIESGGPVTVTHPDAVRVFVTAKETAELLLETLKVATPGSVLSLMSGNKTNVLDLAKNLISSYGLVVEDDIDIDYVGLRDGERLVEETIFDGQEWALTSNKKILVHRTDKQSDQYIGLDNSINELISVAKEKDLTSLLRKISVIVPDCAELGQ